MADASVGVPVEPFTLPKSLSIGIEVNKKKKSNFWGYIFIYIFKKGFTEWQTFSMTP